MRILIFMKSALIFVLVWFVSVFAIALIGSFFDLQNSDDSVTAIFAFAILIIPIFLGLKVLSLRRKQGGNISNQEGAGQLNLGDLFKGK